MKQEAGQIDERLTRGRTRDAIITGVLAVGLIGMLAYLEVEDRLHPKPTQDAHQEPVAPKKEYIAKGRREQSDEEKWPWHHKYNIVFEGQEPGKRLNDIKNIELQQNGRGDYKLKFHYIKPDEEG